MNRDSLKGFCLAASLLPLCAAAPALSQEDEGAFDRTPQDCVMVSRIDDTDATDDQNIIFRMRGDRVYRNTLPRKCPGLERENRIAYETASSRLCSIDTITVLEDFGVGLRPGFTCRLGEFVPLSPAEVEELDLRKRGEAGQSTIETSEVELDRDDDAAESEASDAVDADTDVRGGATQGAVAEGSPDEPAAEPSDAEN